MIIDFKKFRDVEGVTPEEIAETLGISQPYVSQLLNGHRKMSAKRWQILQQKYCNIAKYVISYDEKEDDCNNCNIAEGDDNDEDKIPAYILKMHNEERKRFDEQMTEMLSQNREMLQQNRILVQTIRNLVGDNYRVAEPNAYLKKEE